jgi:hypothetical protein
MRVEQCDGSLVRLTASASITRPESGRFKTENVLIRNVARLDSKHTARVQPLTHHRENSSGPLTVQDEGFANRSHHALGFKRRKDRVPVEKKELSVVRHLCASLSGLTSIE